MSALSAVLPGVDHCAAWGPARRAPCFCKRIRYTIMCDSPPFHHYSTCTAIYHSNTPNIHSTAAPPPSTEIFPIASIPS